MRIRHVPRSRRPASAGATALRVVAVVATTVAISVPDAALGTTLEPTADVQAGHRAGPDTAFLQNVRSCNRFVSKTGNDTTGDSEATAWRTITKAMQQLAPGQTACVHPGTYVEAGPFVPKNTGTAAAPIAIRGFPGEGMPRVLATTDSNLFDFAKSGVDFGYWVVDGFTIDKQQHDGASVRIEGDRVRRQDGTLDTVTKVHHIVVRNNVLRHGKSGAAVLVRNRVTDVLVRNNEISDHHRFEQFENYQRQGQRSVRVDYADAGLPTHSTSRGGAPLTYGRADSHGVSIESDSAFLTTPSVERVRVQSNRLLRNGGDGVQCIGAADGSRQDNASDAADVDLVDNRAEANTEEGVDIKSCQWVSIRGSVSPARSDVASAASNKFLRSRPTDRARDLQVSTTNGNFGGGDLIVLHWNARHVRIENTRLFDACKGIGVGRAEVPVRDLVIRRVLVFGMASRQDPGCASDSSTGSALQLDRVEHADIYHNTFDMPADSPHAAVQVGTALAPADPSKGPFLTGVDFWDNILVSRWWLGLATRVALTPDPKDPGVPWTSGFASDHNLYLRPGAPPPSPRDSFVLSQPPSFRFDAVTLPQWQAATRQDTHSQEADPRFVPDPAGNDYFTRDGSPARDTAAPIAGYGVPACPGSTTANLPDIGFRETCR